MTAIIKKSWIIAFCDELLNRNLNITWQLPTGTRLEAIDFEVAEKLKRTGMVNLAYAPESGSEVTRTLIKKKMKTDDLLASIKSSAQAKLNVAIFAVVGFPHDTPEHLKESVPFFGEIKKLGATDLAINYFMAMPGTELFHSLYDSDHIKLDKAYFGHILQGMALWPDVSYCSRMSRWDLAKWKFRMFWSFYSARNAEGGLFNAILRALKGLFVKTHETRLPAAFVNCLSSVMSTVRVRFKPYWIPREEEELLFQGWDEIYRKIRHQDIEKGVINRAPSDTAEIYKFNVIDTLNSLHKTPRTHLV